MSKFNDYKVYSFRQFEKLDPDEWYCYDLAWPVQIIECYANKASDGLLDALTESVLELLNVPNTSKKDVTQLLNVSEDITHKAINELTVRKFYKDKKSQITDEGKEYLKTMEVNIFNEEKVFGNMFVSRVDGEVFPYFYEGQLPWTRMLDDSSYLSFDKEKENFLNEDDTNFIDRLNKSFRRYGIIARNSKEQYDEAPSEIEFIQEELEDLPFDYDDLLQESDNSSDNAYDDKSILENLKSAHVKLLRAYPKS